MKSKVLASRLLLSWVLLLSDSLSAQESKPMNIDAERDRISQERVLHEAAFLTAERLCYARFAVSDCLRQARKDRRDALDPLRRQELVLNELERKSKATAAIHRIQQKVTNQEPKPLNLNDRSDQPTPAR